MTTVRILVRRGVTRDGKLRYDSVGWADADESDLRCALDESWDWVECPQERFYEFWVECEAPAPSPLPEVTATASPIEKAH